jgi:hypothetical protein
MSVCFLYPLWYKDVVEVTEEVYIMFGAVISGNVFHPTFVLLYLKAKNIHISVSANFAHVAVQVPVSPGWKIPSVVEQTALPL